MMGWALAFPFGYLDTYICFVAFATFRRKGVRKARRPGAAHMMTVVVYLLRKLLGTTIGGAAQSTSRRAQNDGEVYFCFRMRLILLSRLVGSVSGKTLSYGAAPSVERIVWPRCLLIG